jgi:hypothetical protein
MCFDLNNIAHKIKLSYYKNTTRFDSKNSYKYMKEIIVYKMNNKNYNNLSDKDKNFFGNVAKYFFDDYGEPYYVTYCRQCGEEVILYYDNYTNRYIEIKNHIESCLINQSYNIINLYKIAQDELT